MRTTKSEVQAVFERFCKVHGYRIATSYNDVGAYELDHAGIYGGYVINQIANEDGGLNQPFGSKRMRAEAFVDSMRMAIAAHR
jgi:hypothetical protein